MHFSSRRKFATLTLVGGLLVAGAAAAGADFNASGSVSVDPGVSATPPAVTAPSVTGPEMTQAPSAAAPEMTQAPSVTGPEMTQAPSMNAAPPSVDLSDDAVTVTVPLPQATTPEFSDPSVTEPEFSDPSVTEPAFSDPSVSGDVEVSEPSVSVTPGADIQVSAGFSL